MTQKMFVLLAGSSGRILTESAAVPHKRQVIMYSCVTNQEEKKASAFLGASLLQSLRVSGV